MSCLLPLFATLLLLSSGAALAAEQAGVSAAIQGQVVLARATVGGRPVVSGEEIFLQDTLRSGPRSGMQILLLDETVFTIGPESELVVDEFVYDPATGVGRVSAAVTKGVFRFVTGRVARQRPQNMELRLPAGTIGVRGTMAAGRVDPVTKQSVVILLGEGRENDGNDPSGAIEVCNAGHCETARRPGYAISIGGENERPSDPFPMPLPELNAITGAVSDPSGGVDVAAGGGGTDVAAGPGTEGDPRSADDVAGKSAQKGFENAELFRTGLLRNDRRDAAVTDAAQDETQEANADFDLGVPQPLPPDFPVFDANYTTLAQLDALAAAGERSAIYRRSEIGLLDSDGALAGSYDFLLSVDLRARQAYLEFSGIQVSPYGISNGTLSEEFDYSEFPGNAPAAFSVLGNVSGAPSGPCANGCEATGGALIVNQGSVAGAALQALQVIQNAETEETVVTNPAQAVVPRSEP